jgi:hypothetical protein
MLSPVTADAADREKHGGSAHSDQVRHTMQTFTYRPRGVCSKLFEISVEDDKLVSFSAVGGCSGNL